jgi:alanine racemase
MLYKGFDAEDIYNRLLQLESVAMRLEVKQGVQDCLIINDSYNADLNALNIALDFLSQQAVSKRLSKTIILSDILQSGFQPDVLYQKVAELILARNCNKFIGIGEEIGRHAAAFSAIEAYFFPTTGAFLKDPLSTDFRQEAILLKGSRKFGFEQISHKLELIAHETVLEVNLNALVDNLNYFRSKLHRETKIMSMVKAFAYGSGSVEIAKTLQHHRVDYLAVAVADEGAELRRAGIRIPIVVMNPEKSAFDVLFENNLEPEIYSFNLLKSFMEAAGKLALTDYPIHIKIDTGMHRLGFDATEVDGLIELLKSKNQVKVRSVFSHLAGADDPRFDDFTRKQVNVLNVCADKFRKAFPHHILKHILNSAGTERFPEFQFDMVRLGIGHYGVSALPEVILKQVCALKTIVLQLKLVKAGETVGYNRNGVVTEDKLVAMLPIGYADGYNRKLGNGLGEVFVNGKRARVFGNVSMDLIAIDVTGMDIQEGDAVEIFGDHITIAEMSAKLNTIPYEILTGVSRRVKRVYFSE